MIDSFKIDYTMSNLAIKHHIGSADPLKSLHRFYTIIACETGRCNVGLMSVRMRL